MKDEESDFITTVSIITRRLKKGKSYDDFRKVWYHTTGFGVGGKEKGGSNQMFTLINVFEPNEVVVIGFTRTTLEQLGDAFKIEVEFRGKNPMDDVIESEIGRKFYALISEDDFSASGNVPYKSPAVSGKEINLEEFDKNLQVLRNLIADAAKKRDEINEGRKKEK